MEFHLGSYSEAVANTVSILPINTDVAMKLDLPPSDPFDCVIAATADYHDVPLLTRTQFIVESRTVQTRWCGGVASLAWVPL